MILGKTQVLVFFKTWQIPKTMQKIKAIALILLFLLAAAMLAMPGVKFD